MHAARAALLALLLATAAATPALAGTGGAATASTTDGRPPVRGLAFYTTSHADRVGDPTIRVGYSVTPNATGYFLVLHDEDGDVVGHSDYVHPERDTHADGYPVSVDASFSGDTELTVTAYRDSNGNGAFDPAEDEPWTADGEPVSTTGTVSFAGDATTTTSENETTTTLSSGETPSEVATPGFSIVTGALGVLVVGAFAFVRRLRRD